MSRVRNIRFPRLFLAAGLGLAALLPVALGWVGLAASAQAGEALAEKAIELRSFFGTYVGGAQMAPMPGSGETAQHRDLDVVIEPFKDGFRIVWVTVTRVDGRRDVAGVRRQASEQVFERDGKHDYFRLARKVHMFRGTTDIDVIAGDPVLWARIVGRTLSIHQLTIDADGTYLVQTYRRTLAADGASLEIDFERLHNNAIDRRVSGRVVRVRDEP